MGPVWHRLPSPARAVVRSTHRTLRRLAVLPADALDAWRHPGRLLPPRALRFVGDGDFEAIGAEFLQHFVALGGLEPQHRVLDIGSGVGRMAVPLTRFLDSTARYDGFDIVRRGVAWCERRITPRFPHFHFHHADVFNRRYNPRGQVQARTFRFPVDDARVDFAFATSLFTHLLPEDADHYIGEMARVLRPGGRCLCTFFLVNDEVDARVRAGDARMAFRHRGADVWLLDTDVPENAVAYREDRIREAYTARGLAIVEPIRRGAWSGYPTPTTFQDIVVAAKIAP
jgi:SAM-dependent methyltransferase